MNADKVVYARLFLNEEPAKNNLSVVFRKALMEKGVTEEDLNQRIEQYVNNKVGKAEVEDRDAVIANTKKELARDDMSWNVFVGGMKILGVTDITLLV